MGPRVARILETLRGGVCRQHGVQLDHDRPHAQPAQQDPRYFQGGATGFFHRVAYAASRSAITHSRTGQRQFNVSEIGGTLVVANISNLYYPPDERTTHDTLIRWGTQAMWDTVANELKEFWPDIRGMLHGH